MWKTNYPQRHVNSIALHVFVAATVRLQIFDTKEPNFSQMANNLSEIWKKQKGVLFMKHRVQINVHTQYLVPVYQAEHEEKITKGVYTEGRTL